MKQLLSKQLRQGQISQSCQMIKVPIKNFGIMSDYNERKNRKLVGGAFFTPEQKFWVTSARPPNFGDHLDVRTKLDNWFDENRVYNEENRDYEIRRAQLYIYHGFNMVFFTLMIKYGLFVVYQWLIGRERYVRDTYKELDIGNLPPGECLQTIWNGEPIFVRRLTKSEVAQEETLPTSTLLDSESSVDLSPAGNTHVLVCSAQCTHLGMLDIYK
jgi:ubiquinol-cytochrome c reductase iron-sulfur subunit